MGKFVLHSEYKPTGDQPEAIEAFVKGFVIAQLNKPTLIIANNKTLALYSEFKEYFQENAVEYFVSYYDFAFFECQIVHLVQIIQMVWEK